MVPVSEICTGDKRVAANLKAAEIHTAGDSLALILDFKLCHAFCQSSGKRFGTFDIPGEVQG